MQTLVSETISHGRDVADPVAMAAQIHVFRSAALIGASQTAAPLHRADEETSRADPPPARPLGRLPAVHQGLPGFPGQQRNRARHPHSQAETEIIRVSAHPRRCPAILRHPQLSLHRRQARPGLRFFDAWSCSPKASPRCPPLPDQDHSQHLTVGCAIRPGLADGVGGVFLEVVHARHGHLGFWRSQGEIPPVDLRAEHDRPDRVRTPRLGHQRSPGPEEALPEDGSPGNRAGARSLRFDVRRDAPLVPRLCPARQPRWVRYDWRQQTANRR